MCYTTDVIGSCAFGLECNSFKEPDSLFIKYGQKVFTRNTMDQIKDIFTNSFPRLALQLRLKSTSTDVSNFFRNVVNETVSYRERNNISRKDFLQLLIDIKNCKDEETFQINGKLTLFNTSLIGFRNTVYCNVTISENFFLISVYFSLHKHTEYLFSNWTVS